MSKPYEVSQPDRVAVDGLAGATLLDFGTDWCGHCEAAKPLVDEAVRGRAVRHLKVEDGKGRPLGRSFGVKLWPTLVFLRDGVEVARLVRPASAAMIEQALDSLEAARS